MIKARVHSDDRVVEVEFDATPYFMQATFLDLVNLNDCDWGWDYAADAVAEFCRKKCKKLFDYLELINSDRQGDLIGFECFITSEHVLAWLKKHKPWWHRLLTAHIEGESLKYVALLANADHIGLENGADVRIMSPDYVVVISPTGKNVGSSGKINEVLTFIEQALKSE